MNYQLNSLQYVNGLVTDFDLLVLGGFVNRSKNEFKKFLVGVYAKETELESDGKFYAVATISSGLSQNEFAAINAQLRPHWNLCTSVVVPKNFFCGTMLPDVWIDPKKSIIFEVSWFFTIVFY